VVAAVTGGAPVITTATDVQGKLSFDELAERAGLVIENLDMVKALNMAVLEERQIGLFDPGWWLQPLVPDSAGIKVLEGLEEARVAKLSGWIYVDDMLGFYEPPPCLVLRPKSLVVGVGCNRGTTAAEIGAAVDRVFREQSLSLLAVRNVATAELKKDEDGLNELLRERGWTSAYYSADELQAGDSVPTPSEVVRKHVGVESVCEKAAMLSAETKELLVAKKVLGNVTVAVARVGSIL
jgi:cobalt-precorrin 5A hydrolase